MNAHEQFQSLLDRIADLFDAFSIPSIIPFAFVAIVVMTISFRYTYKLMFSQDERPWLWLIAKFLFWFIVTVVSLPMLVFSSVFSLAFIILILMIICKLILALIFREIRQSISHSITKSLFWSVVAHAVFALIALILYGAYRHNITEAPRDQPGAATAFALIFPPTEV